MHIETNSKIGHISMRAPSVHIAIVYKHTVVHVWSDIIITLNMQNKQHRYMLPVGLSFFSLSNITG